jgi:hypothetical protein
VFCDQTISIPPGGNMSAPHILQCQVVHLEGHEQALLLNALLQCAEHALHLRWP